MISVVVIDDDFRVAKIHSSFVARVDGFEVAGVAHSGADALRLVKDVEPDLMLLDLYLPDIFGLDLLNQMRVRGSPLRRHRHQCRKRVEDRAAGRPTRRHELPSQTVHLRRSPTASRRLPTESGFDTSVPTGRPIGDRPALRAAGNLPARATSEGHESGNGHAGPDRGCRTAPRVYPHRNVPNRSAYPGSALAATSSTTRQTG